MGSEKSRTGSFFHLNDIVFSCRHKTLNSYNYMGSLKEMIFNGK